MARLPLLSSLSQGEERSLKLSHAPIYLIETVRFLSLFFLLSAKRRLVCTDWLLQITSLDQLESLPPSTLSSRLHLEVRSLLFTATSLDRPFAMSDREDAGEPGGDT
jgi:hypothetical protein